MKRFASVLVLFGAATAVQALVVDEAGLLSSDQFQALSTLTNDGRVAVHIAPSTHGQALKAYSDAWAKDQKASAPALEVAVTVVPSSHQLFISISQGARGSFTNAEAGQVINQILVPAFRNQDWSGGLTKAVQSIEAQLGSSVATTTASVPATPAPVAVAPAKPAQAPFDAGLVVILALIAGGIGLFVWAGWNRKFRQFEAVVSAGQPDFPMVAAVKGQPEVQQALEDLADLHSALPLGFQKRAAYYGRRKDDFQRAYTTCLRAQQSWDLERRRETEAQARFESLRARADTLPEAERAKFYALESQYNAQGANAAYLLQNMVMMDMMMHAIEPHYGYGYGGNTTVIIEDDERRNGGDTWQTGVDDGFDSGSGGDSGGDSGGGDGGSW